MSVLKCLRCGYEVKDLGLYESCPVCGGELLPHINAYPRPARSQGVWRWKNFMFSGRSRYKLTLGEGNTPLMRSRHLNKLLGISRLYLKIEAWNPTGTFIDRGSATAISVAKHLGYHRIVSASPGDLGISLSAYARQGGLTSKVFMPSQALASKVAKALVISNEVVLVETYEEAVEKARRYLNVKGSMVVLPNNPYLLDGYRTIAYEIINNISLEKLKGSTVVVPIGNGALLTALWSVFNDLKIDVRFIGVKGCSETPIIKDIYVKRPMLKELVDRIISESNGEIIEACEKDVIEASYKLSTQEGLLIGPVGSSPIVALMKASKSLSTAVCILTGEPSLDNVSIRKLLLYSKKKLRKHSLGSTKARILEIVSLKGPLHPYAIWQSLKQEYSYKISLRAIYQHVKELEDMGYLYKLSLQEAYGNRRRNVYSISTKALDVLRL